MATTDARAKVAKLLDTLVALEEEYSGKRAAIHAEMAALLGGGEGIGAKINRLKKDFQRCWRERYGSEYVFSNHAMVGASFKRWLTAQHSEQEIAARIFAYVKTDDRFYVQVRHSFEVFVKAFNQLVGLPMPIGDSTASDTSEKLRGLRGE